MTYSFDLINSALNYHKISKLSLRNRAKIFGISKSVLFNWTLNLSLKYNKWINNGNNITPEMLNFLKRSLCLNLYNKDLKKHRCNKRYF